MIFARKIYKIPEFYVIFDRKMPEFYIIWPNCPKKKFFPNFKGARARARAPLSLTPMLASESRHRQSVCCLRDGQGERPAYIGAMPKPRRLVTGIESKYRDCKRRRQERDVDDY